jgi:hypothetical protein
MQDLTLVGLTEDQKKLVLVSDSGEEFTLAVDAKLRAALRGDHARLGQLEIKMESALRPREIQARIRAGETPETVAAAAQTTVERIMGYATPVLAERAHIADRAQNASVRRKSSEGPTRLLGDAVAERLRSRNLDPETVVWDAWRREDGRWALVADYRSGETPRHAEFIFDAPGRYVLALDDEARWLVGEPSASKGPQPRATSATARRLTAVDTDEDQLPLGEDAIGMVGRTADEEPTEDLSTTAATVRRVDLAPDPAAATGDADWMATQASDRPHRRPEPVDSPAELEAPTDTDTDTETEEEAEADPAAEAPAAEPKARPQPEPEPAEETAEAEEAEEQPVERPARRQVKKNRGRASVPSWDEIMFGGGGKRE